MSLPNSYLTLSVSQKRLSREVEQTLSQHKYLQDLQPEPRRKLITVLIEDLDVHNLNSPSSAWTSQNTFNVVFEALKILGRSPVGSEPLAREKSLRILLEHAYVLPRSNISLPSVLPSHSKDALRTICNTLFLHSSARMHMSAFSKLISSISKLLNATEEDRDSAFLLLRILLFVTSDSDIFVRQAVEHQSLSSYISTLAQAYITAPDPSQDACLIEALKLSYRFTSFYARLTPSSGRISPSSSAESSDRDSLDGRATPTRKQKRPKRFWERRSSSRKEKKAEVNDNGKDSEDLDGPWFTYFEGLITPLISIVETSITFSPLVKHAVNALMFMPANSFPTTPGPFLNSLLFLFDEVSIDILKDEDPGDGIRLETGQLVDETLSSFIWVLRKLARETEEYKKFLRHLLLPDDIDRTLPLDQTFTLTGRLLLIMKSSSCQACSLGAGELFLTVCDRSPTLLAQQIGFGVASGFLTNIKALTAPPDNWFTVDGKEVDGTTGSYVESQRERLEASGGLKQIEEMTEEEKERELVKLMESIDRLNKTGVMKTELPAMTKEMNDKAEERAHEEETIREKAEEAEEEAALRELSAYKARMNRTK